MLWSKSFETGVPLMDEQHQELFRQLDKLSDRSQADGVPQVLDFLGKYVDKHFRDEERLQLSSAYPQRLEHKKMHSDFVDSYRQLMEEYNKKTGQRGLMTLRINRIAVDWLKKHISGPDTAFAKFYLAKQGQPSLKDDGKIWKSAAPAARPQERAERASFTADSGKNVPTDAELLSRFSSRALADELVRRSQGGAAFPRQGARRGAEK